jgi:hypothetical protein
MLFPPVFLFDVSAAGGPYGNTAKSIPEYGQILLTSVSSSVRIKLAIGNVFNNHNPQTIEEQSVFIRD